MEKQDIILERASERDMDVLLRIESEMRGSKTYVPLLNREEALEMLRHDNVFLIKYKEAVVGSNSL